MQLYLIVDKGIRYGEKLPIKSFPATFGRGDQCNFQFKDIGVSRSHFAIEFINNNFVIQDIGSTNGTRLNEERVSDPTILKNDDVIVVGKVLLLRVCIEFENNLKISQKDIKIQEGESSVFPLGSTPIHGPLSDLQIKLSERALSKPGPFQNKQIVFPEKRRAQKTPQLPFLKYINQRKLAQERKEENSITPFSPGNPKSKFSNEDAENIASDDFEKIRIDVTQTSILTPRSELYHSYRSLKTVYEVVQNCNNETNAEKIFQSLLTSICKTINADRGAVVLRLSENDYDIKAFVGEDKKKTHLPVSRTILAEVVEKGLSIISKSPGEDERYRSSESIRLQKVKAIICSPLISQNKIFGAIYLDRIKGPQEPFQHQDLELLSTIGIHVGSILEKSLLLEEVTKANSYLEAVMESVPVGIHTLSLDGAFTSWSSYSQNLFGFSEEEIVGNMYIWDIFYDKEEGTKIFFSVDKEEILVDEIQMQKKDGSLFSCRFALSPILDQSEKILGYTGYHQDITKEKQQREQLFSQEKLAALGMLASGVAHDFNNIFHLILGYTNMAMNEAPQNIKKYLDKIITHIGRAGEISGNLLRYSRHETLEYTDSNPLALLEEILSLVQKELYASDIQILTEFEPLKDQKLIPGQIQEVFLNIILNARDAMPYGGTITIKTFYQEDNNNILFKDTGEGIAPENIKRIFEPFFTTKRDKSTKSGTGLGLAISYQAIQKHGGMILVESIPQNGSQFQIVLPVQESK